MILTRLRQQRFYGWTALAGAMLLIFGAVGNVFVSYGIFLPVMCDELGWSRTALSGPFSGFSVFMGLVAPVLGISIAKFGVRRNVLFGSVAVVLGLLLMSRVKEVWHVYLLYSILTGGGVGFAGLMSGTVLVNNWFTRKRSLAMGLLTAAGGVGGLVMAPLVSWFISALGWQLGWVCLAGIQLVLVAVGVTLIRNRPEELGQVADGVTAGAVQEGDGDSPPPSRVYQTPVDWRVRDALRSPVLWLMVTFAAANMCVYSFLTLHQVSYFQDIGYSPMTAATVAGLLSGAVIVGQLVCGALGIRFEGRYLAVVCLAGFAAGIFVLMKASCLPLVYLYAVLTGISTGGLIVVLPVLLGAYFGRTSFAQITGWTLPVTTLFGAAGPLLGGFMRDASGSYMTAFIAALALVGVGLVCAFFARPPRHPSATELKS